MTTKDILVIIMFLAILAVIIGCLFVGDVAGIMLGTIIAVLLSCCIGEEENDEHTT